MKRPKGSPSVFLFLVGLGFLGISPVFTRSLEANVEVVYQTDDVDTIKVDNPHVTDVVSHSYAKLIFPTEGPLTVGTTFQVVIVNGESGSMLNEVRFSTATPLLNQISALNSGVLLKNTNSDSIWNGTPTGYGFGLNMNNAAAVGAGTSKTYTFQITSGSGTLTYRDFSSSIMPAKGTTDADLDSYVALKWKQNVSSFKTSNGINIPADGIFSQIPGDTFITTNTPVDHFFDATNIASGASGILETTVPVYGAITSKSISAEGVDNTTLQLTKTESFTAVVPTANTVGIVVDLKSGMMELLNQKIADTIAMAGTVDQVMALSLKIGTGPLNQLVFGSQWNYGYDGALNPDRLFAYLMPGTYGTDPIFTGTDYYFQLDFPNYSDTFGTANFSTIVADIHGSQGITCEGPCCGNVECCGEGCGASVPEIPLGSFWSLLASLAAGSFWGRLRFSSPAELVRPF